MQARARQRVSPQAAVAIVVAATLLSLWSLTYTDLFRNWRWGRASLAELQREAPARPNDAVLLYHLGTRLNREERYVEALPYLERATGLDLDKAAYRDAWAKALLATGQISRAFTILSQFVQTHPNSAEGHLYLARFYVAQNATKRATEELEAAVRLKPSLAEAWWLSAVALKAQNQLPLAAEKARKAVALAPDNATYQALLGETLLESGDLTGALPAFDAALKADPTLTAAHVYRARILLDQRGDASSALASATQAVERDPEQPGAQFQRGRALLALNRAGEAVPALEKAAALAPDDPLPASELRRALSQLNRTADASKWETEFQRRTALQTHLRTLQDAHRRDPDDVNIAQQLARFWAERNDVTQAVRYQAKARRMEQDAPPVLIAAANDLTAAGHPEQAVALLKRVKAQTQMNPASFEAMGDALLAQGLAREASLEYETAARWRPEKRAVYQKKLDDFFAKQASRPSEAMRLYSEAVQYEQTRMGPRLSTNKVKEMLLKAAALEPKNVTIRRELTRILFERQERDEAMASAKTLLTLSPDDTVGHALIGVLLVQSASTEAEYNTVQGHLNKARRDPAMSPVVYYGAGLLALRRNQPDAALVALRTARELLPDSDPILFALSQAERKNGNEAEARKLLAAYNRSRADKQAEVNVLKRIAGNPENPEFYREAIAYYEKRGLKGQAKAIQDEMYRRFKTLR